MKILGLYDGHNSHACLIEEGVIVASAEEERFSRIKNHDARLDDLSSPISSTKFCLNGIDDIDYVAIALEDPDTLQTESLKSFEEDIANFGRQERLQFFDLNTILPLKYAGLSLQDRRNYTWLEQKKRIDKISIMLKHLSLDKKPVMFVNHHLAHIASGYYTSPFEDAIVFSLDGKGDDLCGMVALGKNGKIEILDKINYMHSIGHFYSAITVVCGFKAIRHEGKITGLASLGKYNQDLITAFEKLFQFDNSNGRIVSRLGDGLVIGPYPYTDFGGYIDRMAAICKGNSIENIAFNAQYFFEHIVSQWIDYWTKLTGKSNVILSGGVFANVKLNQTIACLKGVSHLFVVPPMNDAGLGWGASLYTHHQILQSKPQYTYSPAPIKNVFMGPEYHSSDIENALKKSGLNYYKPKHMAGEIANMLSENKIVARFDGKMEFGPRALGNRSILFSTQNHEVNTTLNTKLSRSEFMPFAPVSLKEHAHILYNLENMADVTECTKYMTITVNCKETVMKQSPAVVHVDKTARVQFVSQDDDNGLYPILKEYHKLTGVSSVGNTSFNLHEEPIICNPDEAIRSFVTADISAIQLGEFIALNKNQ